MANDRLTDRVLLAHQSTTGLRSVLDEIAFLVYRFPCRFRNPDSEDDCGEFLLFCYPKLKRLVLRFRDQGKPFQAYLNSVLSWQFRSFAYIKRRERSTWNATNIAPVLGSSGPAGA